MAMTADTMNMVPAAFPQFNYLTMVFCIHMMIKTASTSLAPNSENVLRTDVFMRPTSDGDNQIYRNQLLSNSSFVVGNIDESVNIGTSDMHHHERLKRMIWLTDDGRLALPPGTVLSISPTISLPLVRYPPSGFLTNMTMSFPLTSKMFAIYWIQTKNIINYNSQLISTSLVSLIMRIHLACFLQFLVVTWLERQDRFWNTISANI